MIDDKNCGHTPCQYCGDWCDTIAMTKEDIKKNNVHLEVDDNPDNEESYPILCCGGGCDLRLNK